MYDPDVAKSLSPTIGNSSLSAKHLLPSSRRDNEDDGPNDSRFFASLEDTIADGDVDVDEDDVGSFKDGYMFVRSVPPTLYVECAATPNSASRCISSLRI